MPPPNSMKLRVKHTTRFEYGSAVSICHNSVRLRPRDETHQSCLSYQLKIDPEPSSCSSRVDFYGNTVEYFTLVEPHAQLVVCATSEVELRAQETPNAADSPAWETVVEALRAERGGPALHAKRYAFESARIAVVPAIEAYARESFPPGRPIVEALLELTRRVHADFRYDPRATGVHTLPEQVFERRRGVCQDFAQLEIACLRAVGIPARYVSGYLRTQPPPGRARLVGADASHAWLSAYGGALGWIDLDPTNDLVPSLDHVTVAWGRDYGDVCPIEGVYLGGEDQQMTVAVDVTPAVPALE